MVRLPDAIHPRHPDRLVGTKWSAVAPVEPRERHWVVVEWSPRAGEVTLEAVLTTRRVRLAWRALRDRAAWVPGWEPCVDDA